MGLRRFFGLDPYRKVDNLCGIASGKVEVFGRVEALQTVEDPVMGEACVLIEYRAFPPSTTLGMDGGLLQGARGFRLQARQGVEFVLADESARVLVRVPRGEDVARLHQDLLARYGMGLRTEVDAVKHGTALRLRGRVLQLLESSSPHRREPYHAMLQADEIWLT